MLIYASVLAPNFPAKALIHQIIMSQKIITVQFFLIAHILTLLLDGVTVAQNNEIVPTLQTLVANVLENRKNIKQGYAKIEVKWPVNPQKFYEGAVGEYVFYFSPNHLRNDITVKHPTLTKKDIIVTTPKTSIKYWYRDNADLGPGRFTDRGVSFDPEGMILPQLLGIEPYAPISLQTKNFESKTLIDPHATQFVVTQDEIEGVTVLKVTYRIEDANLDGEYWIAPSMGYALLKFMSPRGPKNSRLEYTFDAKWKEYGKSKTWFPSEYSLKISKEGIIEDHINVKIIEADFDKPVTEESFSMQALDIPQGEKFVVNGLTLEYWDGKNFSKYPDFELTNQDNNKSFRRNWVIIFLINVTILIFIIKNLRRRKE